MDIPEKLEIYGTQDKEKESKNTIYANKNK